MTGKNVTIYLSDWELDKLTTLMQTCGLSSLGQLVKKGALSLIRPSRNCSVTHKPLGWAWIANIRTGYTFLNLAALEEWLGPGMIDPFNPWDSPYKISPPRIWGPDGQLHFVVFSTMKTVCSITNQPLPSGTIDGNEVHASFAFASYDAASVKLGVPEDTLDLLAMFSNDIALSDAKDYEVRRLG